MYKFLSHIHTHLSLGAENVEHGLDRFVEYGTWEEASPHVTMSGKRRASTTKVFPRMRLVL